MTDQILGLVPFCDSAGNDSRGFASVVKGELEQFFSLFYRFAVLDFRNPKLNLGEIFNTYLCKALSFFNLGVFLLGCLLSGFGSRLDLLKHFLCIDSCKERLGLAYNCACFECSESGKRVVILYIRIELSENFIRGLGQKRREENGNETNAFKKIVKNRSETCFLFLILGECPRGCFVNVFVTALCKCKYCVKRIADSVFRKELIHLADRFDGKRLELVVNILGNVAGLNNTVKIFVCHGDGTVYKVAECVCKIGIVTFDHILVCD